MSQIDILWVIFVGTVILVLFAVFFITIVIANQKKVITAQKDKLAESLRLAEVLREIPGQIIEGQEEERGRVAKELHDGINQMLASIKYRLHALKAQGPAKGEPRKEWTEQVARDLDATMEEIRRISHALHPKVFDDYGFPAAVRALCDEYAERTHLAVTCELTELPGHLSRGTELSIYRILQEVLHNIEKHAGATAVVIQSRHEGSHWRIRIKDNGKGFEMVQMPASGKLSRGIGLTTMRERAILIGGSLEVHSSPGTGTEVVLSIPG